MGLDKFMGTDLKKEKPKKKPKKTIEKNTESRTVLAKNQKGVPQIENNIAELASTQIAPSKGIEKPSLKSQEVPSFTFVSMSFKCTKCKYKKNMKRPQSFKPSEKDLICPKCGASLKKSRSK